MHPRSLRILPLLAFLLPASALAAFTPRLVKDINPIPRGADSSPGDFVQVGGVSYFAAQDSDTGRELWRTDGTAAGTYRLADICPGQCSSRPAAFYPANVPLFFFYASSRESGGRELWVSGGTPASTLRLTGPLLFPGPGGNRQRWVASKGLLYFTANDMVHGMELWRSDGTPAGTYMVTDLRPGAPSADPREMAVFKDRVYFRADDGIHGPGLWKSDGTAQGTQLVRDPLPRSTADYLGPSSLRPAPSGKFFIFVAPTPQGDYELWKSDGTTKGTAPFTAFAPGPGTALFQDFSWLGDRLVFVAETPKQGQEIWITDGTMKGTRVLTNLVPVKAFFNTTYSRYLSWTAINNRIVFPVDDGVHGVELWATDGTVRGTALLKDVCPGTCSATGYAGVPFKNGLLFSGSDPAHGTELWFTDATTAGTRLVRDLCPGACSSDAYPRAVAGAKAFLRASDDNGNLWVTDGTAAGTQRVGVGLFVDDSFRNGVPSGPVGSLLVFSANDGENGFELWKSDGTTQGTGMLADLNTRDLGGSYPSAMQAVGDNLFFFADDGIHGSELWKSDGTEAGTSLVHEFVPGPESLHGSDVLASSEAAGKLFFILRTSSDSALWRSDGTDAGTVRLTPESIRLDGQLRAVGSLVFFVGIDEDHGSELWKTDGTVGGTARVADLAAEYVGSDPRDFTAFQGRLFFTARTDLGRELWVSDGTEAGTQLVKDIVPDFDSSYPELLTVQGGWLWFFADDPEHGKELWKSDGTEAGTVLAAELAPGYNSSYAESVAWDGARLFISGGSSDIGIGLRITDGTTAGTRFVAPVLFWRDPFREYPPTAFGGALYFAGFGLSQTHPSDILWKTDGTEAGTVPVLDRDGNFISWPRSFQVFGGKLFFTDLSGSLWQSDGTAAGTFPLRELAGWVLNGPQKLTPAGGRLFFPSHDRETGAELWAIDPE